MKRAFLSTGKFILINLKKKNLTILCTYYKLKFNYTNKYNFFFFYRISSIEY